MPLPDLIQATCMHRISNEAFVRFRPLPLRFYAIQGYLDSNPDILSMFDIYYYTEQVFCRQP